MIRATKARAHGHRTSRHLITMARLTVDKFSRLPLPPYETAYRVAA